MGELIHLGRHNEVVLMQALDLLRLQGDRRISPAEGDVRMVSFGFRQITSTLYEGKRLCKILKLKCSLDPLIAVEDSPFRGVAMMSFHLVFIERRRSKEKAVRQEPSGGKNNVCNRAGQETEGES